MGATEQITGIFPVVVAGGIAMKFTQAMFGQQKKRSKKTGKRRSKSGKLNNPLR